MEDSRLESTKRPTKLEILSTIHDNATPRVRRPLFRAEKFDEGRRNSYDGVIESQLPMLPDLGFVAKKKMGVLGSPFRLGTRALRKWSSAQIAAASADINPNQSPINSTAAKRFRRFCSLPDGDLTPSIPRNGISPVTGDFFAGTPPKNSVKHRVNTPVDQSDWQNRGNCSLPLITVTPHGVSIDNKICIIAVLCSKP